MAHKLSMFLALTMTAAPALSQGLGLPPLTDQFAICTGRFAAMMEYQWMRDDPSTGETSGRLATMRDLLDTVTPPEIAGLVLSRENEAKLAFERLLGRTDDDDGKWARSRSAAELAECTELLLN